MSNFQHQSSWRDNNGRRHTTVHRPHVTNERHKNSISKIIKHIFSKSGNKFSFGSIMKKLIGFFIVAGLFGSLLLVAAFGYFSRQLPDIHSILNAYVAQSTKIFDRKGETLLFELHGDQKRTVIELDQISPYIKNGLIAAEDKNFYTHSGFSVLGILRSLVKNTFTGSSTGGSTLTQQMIRNTVLTKEKTYTRKIKELILAREAEKSFSKDEILKIYLNTINYGGVNYGVEAASQAFFGKHALDVSLNEAAVLAALPQGPTRLSPYGKNVDQLLARKDWVLDRMVEEGYIKKDEADKAKAEKMVFQKQQLANIKAPHFVFYVQQLLVEQFGEDVANQGGLKVITTLDWDKQQMAEEAVKGGDEFNKAKGANDAALVSLDAKTGEILAMVGSQDYFNDEIAGKVNVAIEKRQPGSSIKPIVYAAAIAKGFTAETVVYDAVTNFALSGKDYTPHDYDLKERGPVTFRKALAGSLNIPAVKALYLAGVPNVLKILSEDLQYPTITKESDCGLSLVLGGCEVTLLDHATAYTAFARDGEMAKHGAILQVLDKNGNELYKFKPETKKVWEPDVARTINNILSDNEARTYVFGANNSLTLGTRPVAAKTGTTNDYNDAWTMGYTPSFVTGVWVGNADGTDMKKGADGSIVAAPIWNAYMKKLLANSPVEYFKGPDPLPDDLKPALKGNVGGITEIEVDKFSGKLATAMTPDSAKEKRVYREDHDILYYVNKDDPRGPAPADPATADPQEPVWEAAIKEWVVRDMANKKAEAEKAGQVFDETTYSAQPPTEFDDVHIQENIPQLSINSPANNQVITSPQFEIQVSTSSNRGVRRVEYFLGAQQLGVATNTPFNFTATLGTIKEGFYTLRAVAYDDVDNSKEVTIELNIKTTGTGQNSQASIDWSSPRNESTIAPANFPLPINFTISSTSGIQEVRLYDDLGGTKTLIQDLKDITDRNLSVLWEKVPAPGTHNIYAEITDTNGNQMESNRLVLKIIE